METLRQGLRSRENLARILEDLFLPERDKKPISAQFNITTQCNAHCGFCVKGPYTHGEKKGSYGPPDLEQQKEILRLLRRDVPNIYLSGGEPTAHPHLRELLEECSKLNFDSVTVNTNGLLFKPEILQHADILVFSLHAADPAKNACVLGLPPQKGEQIFENLEHYIREHDSEKTTLVVNCVITGDSIQDAIEVAKLCKKLGIKFNPAPAIMPNRFPDSRLIENTDWILFIDWLMQQNGLIASSAHYLQKIKGFSPFACTPNLTPSVYPNGDINVPCDNAPDHVTQNVLERGGLISALRTGRAAYGKFDPSEECAEKCHQLCWIEGSAASTPGGIIKLAQGAVMKAISNYMAN